MALLPLKTYKYVELLLNTEIQQESLKRSISRNINGIGIINMPSIQHAINFHPYSLTRSRKCHKAKFGVSRVIKTCLHTQCLKWVTIQRFNKRTLCCLLYDIFKTIIFSTLKLTHLHLSPCLHPALFGVLNTLVCLVCLQLCILRGNVEMSQ